MVSPIKTVLGCLVTCIEADNYSEAMQAIAHFTVLFEGFLQENKDHIFEHEVMRLNHCMYQMIKHMEQYDLQSLKEIIQSFLLVFLDDWDFNNKQYN